MKRDFDIYSYEWCHMVFEGKNQKYGAFQIRHQSWKRHKIALFSVVIVFVIAIMLPGFLHNVMPENKMHMVEVTSLSDLQIEKVIPKEEMIAAPSNPPSKSTIKFTVPEIKEDDEVEPTNEIKTQDELNETEVAISVADVKGTGDGNFTNVTGNDGNGQNGEMPGGEMVLEKAELMPEFPGGEVALRRWIAEHLKYPRSAQEKGIQGRVVVTFIIDKEGNVTDVAVKSGIDPTLDKEALRVIKNLPKWTPGKHNGSEVSVLFTIPINFSLP